jgi:IS5 family transposase
LQGVVIGSGDVVVTSSCRDGDSLQNVLVGDHGHVVADKGVQEHEDVEDKREDHLCP